MSSHSERYTRRQILRNTGFFLLGGTLTLSGCSNSDEDEQPKSDVEEYVIQIGEVFAIDQVREKVTNDVGVERLLLLGADEPPLIFVFFELSNNAVGIRLNERRQNSDFQGESGFVPFDQNFDLNKAAVYLSDQSRTDNFTVPGGFDTAAEAGRIFEIYRKRAGYLAVYSIPTTERGVMFLFDEGFNALRTDNSKIIPSPPAILKVRIKFIGHSPDEPGKI